MKPRVNSVGLCSTGEYLVFVEEVHKAKVLLRYPAGAGDHAHADNSSRQLSYHEDSFGWATLDTGRKADAWFYLAALRKAGPAAQSRWRTAQIAVNLSPRSSKRHSRTRSVFLEAEDRAQDWLYQPKPGALA